MEITFVLFLLAIAFAGGLFCLLFDRDSHSGPAPISALPASPVKQEGPWFLRIEFLESVNRSDVYAKADDITSLYANTKTNELHIGIAYKHHEVFKKVSYYEFVQASQMGEFLYTEEETDDNKII